MVNYRTTIGGAVSTVGKGLIMMGVLPQLAGHHDNVLWYMTLAGYVINIIGEALVKFFAADAAEVARIASQVNTNAVTMEGKQDKP